MAWRKISLKYLLIGGATCPDWLTLENVYPQNWLSLINLIPYSYNEKMLGTKMFHTKMTKLTFIKEKLFSKFEVQIVLNQIPWFLIYFSGFKYKGFEEPSPNKDLFRDYLRILLKNCKYQKDWNSVKKILDIFQSLKFRISSWWYPFGFLKTKTLW